MTTTDWKQRVPLGRTGLQVSRMGIASGYGIPAAAIERAFHEYGINYFYMSFPRRGRMLAALKHLLPQHQDQLVVVLAKPVLGGFFMRSFVERWLRKLRIERVSVLLLQSIVSRPPPPALIERAMALKEEGKVRYIGMSSHNRPLLGRMARGELGIPVDLFQLRYNAVHRGAEQDIFPHLATAPAERPGIVCFTATCWRKLLNAKNMPDGEQPLTAAQCYRFVLHQPKIDVCVTGPANAGQMEENLAALKDGPLSDAELSRIKRIGDHIYGKKR